MDLKIVLVFLTLICVAKCDFYFSICNYYYNNAIAYFFKGVFNEYRFDEIARPCTKGYRLNKEMFTNYVSNYECRFFIPNYFVFKKSGLNDCNSAVGIYVNKKIVAVYTSLKEDTFCFQQSLYFEKEVSKLQYLLCNDTKVFEYCKKEINISLIRKLKEMISASGETYIPILLHRISLIAWLSVLAIFTFYIGQI